MKHRNMLNIL